MDDKPRRPSGWKVFFCFAGAVGVIVGTVVLWVNSVANRRWAAMEVRVRERIAEIRARDAARPVLRGQATPGNAWDDYEPALQAMRALKSDKVLGEFVSRGPAADRTAAEALVAAHGGALDGLRRGAQREEAQYSYRWEDGASANCPGLLHSQRLGNLAVSLARLLAEGGRGREAAELLLDVCQFARDECHNGLVIAEMIGMAIWGLALDELHALVGSGKLSREELLQIERELGILDGSFARHGWSMRNEAASAGATFSKIGMADLFESGIGISWRYAFSFRIQAADAFDVMDEWMRRCDAAEAGTWSDVQKLGQEVQRDASGHKNSLVQLMMPGLIATARPGRDRRAHLRLLRAACRFRATGQVPELDDPYGAKLLSSRTGDVLKVWSIGSNGVDDGGTGGWKIPPNQGDILIEVEP